jgi:prepilin-type N-terminal cleavage/methylation domain-containing protein
MKKFIKSFSTLFPIQLRAAGMSLVEVMVVAAVFGIVIVAVNNMMLSSLSTLKMMEQKNEVLDLRRILRLRLNCLKTKEKNDNWKNCSTKNKISETRISGRDEGNVEVISSNGTNYGAYIIKMTCLKSDNSVNLIVSVSTSQKEIDTDLFQKVPLTCQL